jgi:hypothetical protein
MKPRVANQSRARLRSAKVVEHTVAGARRRVRKRERNPVNWILRPNELHERSLRLPLVSWCYLGATVMFFLSCSPLFLAVLCPLISVVPFLFVRTLEDLRPSQLSS